MTVQEIKQSIENLSCNSLQVEQIKKLAQEYPYVSLFQQMYSFAHKEVTPRSGLYKTHPFLHAYHLSKWKILVTDDLIDPVYTTDYFMHQGISASEDDVEEMIADAKEKLNISQESQLMITRSFEDWLLYFKEKKQKEKKEAEEKLALKAMWQREKLTQAIEEEGDVVPEEVFKMAMDSLNNETSSEVLAEILVKQRKYTRAIEMYRKLSLLNPEKRVYFAAKIKELEKID